MQYLFHSCFFFFFKSTYWKCKRTKKIFSKHNDLFFNQLTQKNTHAKLSVCVPIAHEASIQSFIVRFDQSDASVNEHTFILSDWKCYALSLSPSHCFSWCPCPVLLVNNAWTNINTLSANDLILSVCLLSEELLTLRGDIIQAHSEEWWKGQTVTSAKAHLKLRRGELLMLRE